MPRANRDLSTKAVRKLSVAEFKPKIRPFARALPITMLRAREALMQRFRPIVQTRSLTDQQMRIMRALGDLGTAEILTLSEECVIHPASLSRILPKMEGAGYITRRTNEADKRRVIVSLTDQGREVLEYFGPQVEAAYAAIERDVGSEQVQQLYDLLDHLIEALNSPRKSNDS